MKQNTSWLRRNVWGIVKWSVITSGTLVIVAMVSYTATCVMSSMFSGMTSMSLCPKVPPIFQTYAQWIGELGMLGAGIVILSFTHARGDLRGLGLAFGITVIGGVLFYFMDPTIQTQVNVLIGSVLYAIAHPPPAQPNSGTQDHSEFIAIFAIAMMAIVSLGAINSRRN